MILVSITGTILVVYALLYLCLDMMEDQSNFKYDREDEYMYKQLMKDIDID